MLLRPKPPKPREPLLLAPALPAAVAAVEPVVMVTRARAGGQTQRVEAEAVGAGEPLCPMLALGLGHRLPSSSMREHAALCFARAVRFLTPLSCLCFKVPSPSLSLRSCGCHV